MGLNTDNAGALLGKTPKDGTHTVKVLIGTFIASVGRDVKKGEVVDVSAEDYRFLKPYKFVEDRTEEVAEIELNLGTQGNAEGDKTGSKGKKKPTE
jgi:hypothetical protein